MPTVAPLYCRIHDLVLDESTGTLLRGAQQIQLPRLSFALLLVLARRAPAIVSPQELMQAVWDSTFVSDETVQQRVKLLRQALDDNPKQPRYIANVRGKGYRLIAGVEWLVPPLTAGERLQSRSTTFKGRRALFQHLWKPFVLLLAVLFAGYLYLMGEQDSQGDVAVDLSWHSANATARGFYFNGKDYVIRGVDQHNEAAIIQFQQALDLDANYALAYAGLSHAYLARAVSFGRGERWLHEAELAAERAIVLLPEAAEVHAALALVYHVKGMNEQAYNGYLQALRYQPDHYKSLLQLAVLSRERGELHEALVYGLVATLASPHQFSGYHQVAELFAHIGLLEHAVAWYRMALAVAPQNQNLHFSLCSLHIRIGDLAAANASCMDMIHWSPEDSWGYEWVGELELLNGNRERAVMLYKQAMELGSNYATFRYASFLHEDGAVETARPMLQQALQVMLDYQRSRPSDSGAILNLLDYYGALGDEPQVYYWLKLLLQSDYTDAGYFLHNSCFTAMQSHDEFQALMQQLHQKQARLQQKVPAEWWVLPEQMDDIRSLLDAALSP